jgi:hypothetical protein
MGQAIPTQHPSVVLRSHYNHLRALLAVAMIAVVGLTVAVVILANDNDDAGSTSAAVPVESGGTPGEVRYDGGPEEGTAGLAVRSAPATFDPNSIKEAPGVRYDGGPEEGTRGPIAVPDPPGTRYDGGPDEGTRGPIAVPDPPGTRYDGGPEEGSRGSGR